MLPFPLQSDFGDVTDWFSQPDGSLASRPARAAMKEKLQPAGRLRSRVGQLGMDTLSLVSKYLNGMEDILDDGDSMEARKLTVERAPPRAYNRPFTRFSFPCDVDGQDYGKYGRKVVKEIRKELHGFTFLVDFVVIVYVLIPTSNGSYIP
nr:hypothetical protein [Tanacetum cinerariifolium]